MKLRLITMSCVAIGLGASLAMAYETDPVGSVGSSSSLLAESCERVSVCSASPAPNGEAYVSDGLLWQTDFSDKMLKLVDINANCTVLSAWPAPGGISPSENAYDLQYLYHYDFGTGLIYQINPTTGAVVSSANAPGDDLAEGFTYDPFNRLFWKGDSTQLYAFTYNSGTITVQFTCPNPPGDSADGLALCGEYILMLGYSGTLYQIDKASCSVESSCSLNLGAAGNGLASDLSGTLWVDQPGFLDKLDRQCDRSVDSEMESWGSLKSLFR